MFRRIGRIDDLRVIISLSLFDSGQNRIRDPGAASSLTVSLSDLSTAGSRGIHGNILDDDDVRNAWKARKKRTTERRACRHLHAGAIGLSDRRTERNRYCKKIKVKVVRILQ